MQLTPLYVFPGLAKSAWWRSLTALSRELAAAEPDEQKIRLHYRRLAARLIGAGHASLAHALATGLLYGKTLLPQHMRQLPAGLRQAAELDLAQLQAALHRDWQGDSEQAGSIRLPPLSQLAEEEAGELPDWVTRIAELAPAELLDALQLRYAQHGQGLLARWRAFQWTDGTLRAIERPATADWSGLAGLERQLGLLQQEAEAFLQGLPAQDTLLYGPRGSGKSTAVRGLLTRYAASGLRMIEVPVAELQQLPLLLPQLQCSPHRFVLFVDDLGFEGDDDSYQPLKTLLDGTLVGRPANTLIIATSNRRHLLKQRFSDRPDPLDDDVHAWDTQQQQLALSDRFGRVITFPYADQRRYLELVNALAADAGLSDLQLAERAISFAEWGNGYSGRTARQFIDTCIRKAAPGPASGTGS
jgi:predicted AAA+ superfamily ATPase